jgi:hypothetical protein
MSTSSFAAAAHILYRSSISSRQVNACLSLLLQKPLKNYSEILLQLQQLQRATSCCALKSCKILSLKAKNHILP